MRTNLEHQKEIKITLGRAKMSKYLENTWVGVKIKLQDIKISRT